MLPILLIPTTYLLLTLLLPAPTTPTRAKTPLLALNFPDPCIIQDAATGQWYAFATGSWTHPPQTPNNNNNTTTTPTWKNIQAATAPSPNGKWTYLPDTDPLPSAGAWTAPGPGSQTWAPSVIHLGNNSSDYVLYYAAQLGDPPGSQFHCIGAAVSHTGVLGPYLPLAEPVVCPLDQGGAIDPSGFLDPVSGRRFFLYKVDGNALGEGGECNNGVGEGRRRRSVRQGGDGGEGVGLVGEGVEVLDRVGEVDGPLVEAPDLVYCKGYGYVLFYSNHCWDGPGYSVNYAVARNIEGPYERGKGGRLIGTGDAFNVTAPGGAASVPGGSGGGWMVLFHGDCPQGRCLFGAGMEVTGGMVVVS
ncbi:putative arabinan endo-1,5-alpha-L-arabinosidase C [Chaetomidium leptoderma]|uniref:Arabinan endo-1,5-alpha-L-arabinosidase C n=1 Tax=Chaetomidium leptoderma TaxID=669021 RepID=A0AAN6VMZ1_9PEZI|nr:putative arabinan endo-1,5-alpha-L-arabinosidase C [Chaetomidium leptoderma]